MSFSIESAKETGLVQVGVIPKPLILVQITATSGDTVYLTTTPALGGQTLTYPASGGNTYQARLLSNPIEAIQSQSAQGYDIPGSINLSIDDSDFVIWTQHANLYGWRGGLMTVTFLLWDIPSNTFSTSVGGGSGSYIWTFICDKPNIDANGVLTLAGQARESLTRLTVPNVARQNRCGHTFPPAGPAGNPSKYRLDGLTNPTSIYYACGYSPDVGGPGNTTTANLLNPNGSQLTDGSGIYVSCDYTRSCGSKTPSSTQGCMARLGHYAGTLGKSVDGDITHDVAGHATARFDGDTWIAPVEFSGKQYVNPSAGTIYGFNTPNPATGTTFYPQGYGTQWVTATSLAPAGDPNSNRCEAIVCIAPNGPATIHKVLVSGVEIAAQSSDNLLTFRVLSAGGRSGAVNGDAIYDSQGDPHGGLCALEVVVLTELAGGGAPLTVNVLVSFPQCLHAYPVATAVISGSNTILTLQAGIANNFADGIIAGQSFYFKGVAGGGSGVPDAGYTASSVTTSAPGTITIPGNWTGTGGAVYYYPTAYADDAMIDSAGNASANPVWALMDLLTWGPFTVKDFDIQTWYDAAQICAALITYQDINGNSATHARYRCSFALTTDKRQSMAKAVLGLRNCAGIILGRNPVNGLLQCFIEETLADQQPAPIPGSNYNTAVASLTAGSTAPLTPSLGTPGYIAYLFDGAGSIEKGTFKLGGRSLNDTPNTVAFPFQDSANAWVQDSCTTIDPNGYISSGNQEIESPLQVLGIENFDQATRRSNIELAKALYGNARFDEGGTELPSFKTTVKAAHLASRVGFICGINYEQLDL